MTHGIPNARAEWLEADGLGGFASGTVGLERTRRYHALLLASARPPVDRLVLVNGLEARVETPAGPRALSTHRYAPDVVHPDGASRLVGFEREPWPAFRFRLDDGTEIVQEILALRDAPAVLVRFRALDRQAGRAGALELVLRPLMSGRDYHALQRENGAFRFDAEDVAGGVRLRPYPDVPATRLLGNGRYRHAPDWYRRFTYEEERRRGLDHEEDLASPGELRFDLAQGDAWLVLVAETPGWEAAVEAVAQRGPAALVEGERRRRADLGPDLRAAEAYLVRRGDGASLVAGYPWFADGGRDTFLAMRGPCLATGRLDEATSILLAWSDAVSQGMLPNRFADRGEEPEYNSVDAALWYCVAVADLATACARRGTALAPPARRRLADAVQAILEAHVAGTRHGIACDDDGLLAAGAPGQQLTWMDARVRGREVTPRCGKPVEIQALWHAALITGAAGDARWARLATKTARSFVERFWCDERGFLADVVDVDHERGRVDATLRPNQVLAVGGLPATLLDGERARRVVDVVERRLWTPLGLRSLAPEEPGYRGRYLGGVDERDSAYHQGTAWPWLLGPFVEAWLAVRGRAEAGHAEAGHAEATRAEARRRFLAPLRAHLDEAGLGHGSEVADGDAPHAPGGCPFQAWSLGELLRLELDVLAPAQADAAAGMALGSP
jgi:predicted glycogen debranching enzyme